MDRRLAATLAAALAVATFVPASIAQAPGIKRTLLQKSDVSATQEVVLGMAEIAPGGTTGRHTHFGVETGYVLEGGATMLIDGQPPREMKAGDTYLIPAGVVHEAKVSGAAPGKVLATYVVEKGKPLATPAP